MYGNHALTLRSLVLKVLSQIASSSTCERNLSTFAPIHTKQRNRLAYPRLQQLVFCYYNMKLKTCDMQVETGKVAEKEYFDLLNISIEFGEEEVINYSNGLDLSILLMKMEIWIHELLHLFEKHVLMLREFYLKKFIVKVLVKTQETHFNPLSLLDPLLIQVLNIVVYLFLHVLLL